MYSRVFDISDLKDLELITSDELDCGSHTATAVPDPANDRLLLYNAGSSSACEGIDIVEIPLSDPTAAPQVNFIPRERDCHDIGVILGNAMMAACAGDGGYAALDLGGALDSPTVLYDSAAGGGTLRDRVLRHAGGLS